MIEHFGILCIYKNKGADQLRGTAQLISTVVFAAKRSTFPLCPCCQRTELEIELACKY